MKGKPETEISKQCMYIYVSYLQNNTLIKVVRTGTPLQGGESHVSSSEGGDVAELVGT